MVSPPIRPTMSVSQIFRAFAYLSGGLGTSLLRGVVFPVLAPLPVELMFSVAMSVSASRCSPLERATQKWYM